MGHAPEAAGPYRPPPQCRLSRFDPRGRLCPPVPLPARLPVHSKDRRELPSSGDRVGRSRRPSRPREADPRRPAHIGRGPTHAALRHRAESRHPGSSWHRPHPVQVCSSSERSVCAPHPKRSPRSSPSQSRSSWSASPCSKRGPPRPANRSPLPLCRQPGVPPATPRSMRRRWSLRPRANPAHGSVGGLEETIVNIAADVHIDLLGDADGGVAHAP
jgi:hypothetical protein